MGNSQYQTPQGVVGNDNSNEKGDSSHVLSNWEDLSLYVPIPDSVIQYWKSIDPRYTMIRSYAEHVLQMNKALVHRALPSELVKEQIRHGHGHKKLIADSLYQSLVKRKADLNTSALKAETTKETNVPKVDITFHEVSATTKEQNMKERLPAQQEPQTPLKEEEVLDDLADLSLDPPIRFDSIRCGDSSNMDKKHVTSPPAAETTPFEIATAMIQQLQNSSNQKQESKQDPKPKRNKRKLTKTKKLVETPKQTTNSKTGTPKEPAMDRKRPSPPDQTQSIWMGSRDTLPKVLTFEEQGGGFQLPVASPCEMSLFFKDPTDHGGKEESKSRSFASSFVPSPSSTTAKSAAMIGPHSQSRSLDKGTPTKATNEEEEDEFGDIDGWIESTMIEEDEDRFSVAKTASSLHPNQSKDMNPIAEDEEAENESNELNSVLRVGRERARRVTHCLKRLEFQQKAEQRQLLSNFLHQSAQETARWNSLRTRTRQGLKDAMIELHEVIQQLKQKIEERKLVRGEIMGCTDTFYVMEWNRDSTRLKDTVHELETVLETVPKEFTSQ